MSVKRSFLLLAAPVIFALMTACGGGVITPPESRVVNALGNTVQNTVGSRGHKLLTLNWVGVDTNQTYGTVRIESVTKSAGTGDITIHPDGTLDLANDLANDVFRFSFTAHHPNDPGDPDAGKPVSGSAVVTVTPENPRIDPSVTNPFTIAEGGTMVLGVQAENARSSSGRIVRVTDITRAFVYTPATWGVVPADAGAFTASANGIMTFAAASGFSGNLTITARVSNAIGGPFTATVNGTVVAHPTVVILAPAETATVSGTVTVQFTATHATRVEYQLGTGAFTVVTGNFTFDSRTLPNGPLAITVRATGSLEAASMTRSVVVNNQPAYNFGKAGEVVIPGTLLDTNSDSKKIPNRTGYAFKNGGFFTLNSGGLLRIFDVAGKVVKSVDLKTGTYNAALDGSDRIWIPCDNDSLTYVFDKTGTEVRRIATDTRHQAKYVPQNNTVLVCGPEGILEFNPATFAARIVTNTYAVSVCGDGHYIFYLNSSSHLIRMVQNPATNESPKDLGKFGLLYDLYSPPGYNLIVGTDKNSKTIVRVTKDGSTAGYPALPLPGGPQVAGIGIDCRDSSGTKLLIPPDQSAGPYGLYLAAVVDR